MDAGIEGTYAEKLKINTAIAVRGARALSDLNGRRNLNIFQQPGALLLSVRAL